MSDTTLVRPTSAKPEIRGVTYPEDPRAERVQKITMLIVTVLPLVGVVAAMVQLWGWGITPVDFSIFLGFYVLTGLGITVGYHRLFTHKSFDAPKPVRIFWAIAGSLAVQGSVIDWVATHRRHHAFSDEFGDPHSPHLDAADGFKGVFRGLYHAHLGWMFNTETTSAETWAPDLLQEDAIVRIDRAFPKLIIATFVLPAIIGGLVTMSFWGAVSAAIWGGLVRMFLLHHVTWAINSICHFYGTRPFESRDEARNNPIMALLAFGEGWHNAHHAFPASARHGLRWWEFDASWITIRTMQVLGLARNIKLPSSTQLARKRRRAHRAAA
ncbi:MAG: acyl-CoA desaturase [Actinobacteria bacterium]|nr:acyl-CoA desaturase [Actinomycetota bacterium]